MVNEITFQPFKMSSLSFKIDDLGGMKFSELSKLAQKEGIDQDKIDSAMDDDVPKNTLISLLTKMVEEKRQDTLTTESELDTDTNSYMLSTIENKIFIIFIIF